MLLILAWVIVGAVAAGLLCLAVRAFMDNWREATQWLLAALFGCAIVWAMVFLALHYIPVK